MPVRIFFTILFFSLFFVQASAQALKIMIGSIDPTQQKSIDLKELVKQQKLVCTDTNYKVSSFAISLYVNERLEVEGPLFVKGMEFDQQTINMLKRNFFNSGKLYIDEIKVMGPDRRTRGMSSITLNYPQ